MFYAQRGRGAFLNGEPLHASGQEGDITHTNVTSHLYAESLRWCCTCFRLFCVLHSDVSRCVVVTEIGAERDDLALSTMTSNIFRLLKIPVHG